MLEKVLKKGDNIELHLSMTATVNIGNYESVKVNIGLTVPTKIKDLDKTRKAVEDYIEKYLDKKVEEIKEGAFV